MTEQDKELSNEDKIQRIREIFEGLRKEEYPDPNKKYDRAAHQLLMQLPEDEAEQLMDEFEDVFDKFTYKEREDEKDLGGTVCTECYKVFKNRKGMRTHRTRTHDTILIEDDDEYEEFKQLCRDQGEQLREEMNSLQIAAYSSKDLFREILKSIEMLPHTESEKEQYYGDFFEAFKQGLEGDKENTDASTDSSGGSRE